MRVAPRQVFVARLGGAYPPPPIPVPYQFTRKEILNAVFCTCTQTDGGYLGSDLDSFFSAVVSSAAGFYAVLLTVQNAGITTLLTVRPGQSVAVTGDPSLPQPPDW